MKGTCPVCRKSFIPTDPRQIYCRPAHRQRAFYSRFKRAMKMSYRKFRGIIRGLEQLGDNDK